MNPALRSLFEYFKNTQTSYSGTNTDARVTVTDSFELRTPVKLNLYPSIYGSRQSVLASAHCYDIVFGVPRAAAVVVLLKCHAVEGEK